MNESPAPSASEPLEAALTSADDRLRLNHWLPPQNGIVPRIRIGQRWPMCCGRCRSGRRPSSS